MRAVKSTHEAVYRGDELLVGSSGTESTTGSADGGFGEGSLGGLVGEFVRGIAGGFAEGPTGFTEGLAGEFAGVVPLVGAVADTKALVFC